MTFQARSRTTIRTDILASLGARWTAAGAELDTRSGSFFYRVADVFALVLAPLESWAASLADQILPDRALTAFLNRHGDVEGLPREAAIPARLTIRVFGTPSTTVTFGSAQFRYGTSGLRYSPLATSVLLNGSGYGDADFVAVSSGPASNLANGTTVVWVTTPVNATATGIVQATVTAGADAETDASYAARIVARRQERPASGNRADWRDWVEATTAVTEGWVYPLLDLFLGADTLGSVTVVVTGPPQGDSTVNTRILSGPAIALVKGYIEGTHDAEGNVVTNGVQLRPVTLLEGNYNLQPATVVPTAADLVIRNAAAYPFPWSGTMTLDGASTATSIVVANDQTSKNGTRALFLVGTANIRGGWAVRTLDTGVYNGGTNKTTWTLSETLPATPGALAYPAPANWESIRLAVFDYFDTLGPGDSTGGSRRWPGEETKGRATLYKSALAAAVINGAQGVLSATASGSDVTPTATGLVTLDTLLVTEAP